MPPGKNSLRTGRQPHKVGLPVMKTGRQPHGAGLSALETGRQPYGVGPPTIETGRQPYGAGPPALETGRQPYGEGPPTHISIQQKIIVYDPLVMTCPCPLILGSESLHEGGKGSYSGGVSPTGRKRSPDSESADSSKRHKGDKDTDSDSPSGIADFDPASLVQSREGTMKVPGSIQKYLDKHLRHCLTKEER